MTISTGLALESLPAVVFQFSGKRLELLNRDPAVYPHLTPLRLSKILRGEWKKLVPEEFHSVVGKLAAISKSASYTTVEFPVYWMENTVWLRVFAAAVSDQKGKRTIIGLAQDVTSQRQSPLEMEQSVEEDEDPWRKLRHDINSSLTSIIMNCELLLGSSTTPDLQQKVGAILSEALRVDQSLQHYRG